MGEKEQQKGLAVKELDGGRALTRAEFHQLSDVPPAVEWFANIRNRHTFVGIKSPNEFRIVTRDMYRSASEGANEEKTPALSDRRKPEVARAYE